ncbi:MAG: aldo/keto reductase [Polyangiales bacterium]
MSLSPRPFGATGLRVSAIGLGTGRIGEANVSDGEASRLLGAALDLGVTLIDTARSYGLAEERIGRHLAHRRDDFVLSTKGGYGVEGVADWTYDAVARGVDDALRTMRTARIDVFHLHSCPAEVLARGEVLRALEDARKGGKIGVAAYSGENDALDAALASRQVGAVQCSVNLCDQRSLDAAIARAAQAGLGVIGKRPLANAPWRFPDRPVGDYAETYWGRLRAMRVDPGPLEWPELAIRFAAHAPGVSSVIAGTANVEHLQTLVAAVGKGALPAETTDALRATFRAHDDGWTDEI